MNVRDHGWQMVGTYPGKHAVGGFEIYKTLADVVAELKSCGFSWEFHIPKLSDAPSRHGSRSSPIVA